MSTHVIPSPAADTRDSIRWERVSEVQRLAVAYLGRESTITDNGTTLSLVFTPDLTAPQILTLNRLIAISGLMRVTPAEWALIEADLATMRAFTAIGTPTLANNSNVNKAMVRILRALLRD